MAKIFVHADEAFPVFSISEEGYGSGPDTEAEIMVIDTFPHDWEVAWQKVNELERYLRNCINEQCEVTPWWITK